MQRQEMERSLQAGVAAAGACTRMRFQALPYSVTLVCSGFLQVSCDWSGYCWQLATDGCGMTGVCCLVEDAVDARLSSRLAALFSH